MLKLNETCRELKKLRALQKLFLKEVGITSWEEAKAKFPLHASDEQLKQFTYITIRNDATPPSFLHHCQKALKSLASDVEGESTTFAAVRRKGGTEETFTAAMMEVEPEAIVYNDITKHLPKFSGFGLAFRSMVDMKEEEVDEKVHNPTPTIPLLFSILCSIFSN